ncbi:MAG: LON peptidase substrate-binding domain-containing protein [Chloroflexi bacterium]|nr:LON peptidase substrate-binding domain-containing protein [Chloroflexota bacterium]
MSKYILLPLRTNVAFPGLSAAVTVEETTWVTALERALVNGAQVVALALRESDTEGLDPHSFYGVGTLADLKSVTRRPGGGADVTIEGVARVAIEDILTVRKPFQVRTVDLQEEESPLGAAVGQMKTAAALTERYSRLSRVLPPNVLESIAAIRRPGPLADYLASHLPLDIATKQEVLETLGRVRRQMERNQREYYLKEQLKAINAELGQEAATEAEALRTRAKEKGLPEAVEQRVMQDISRLERTPATSPESGVLRNYLELTLNLPWNDHSDDRLDVDCAQTILNEDHYGLDQVKDRILEYLAVKQLLALRDGAERVMARGPVLCLVGPRGQDLAGALHRARHEPQVSAGGAGRRAR